MGTAQMSRLSEHYSMVPRKSPTFARMSKYGKIISDHYFDKLEQKRKISKTHLKLTNKNKQEINNNRETEEEEKKEKYFQNNENKQDTISEISPILQFDGPNPDANYSDPPPDDPPPPPPDYPDHDANEGKGKRKNKNRGE